MNNDFSQGVHCPVPIGEYDTIVLAHGGGGKFSHNLIEQVFKKYFSNSDLDVLHDGAMLHLNPGRIALSTDS